jgi:hypothetical protein
MADIGRWLKPLVSGVDGLAGVPVFPVFAPATTPPPFITYRRQGGSADKSSAGRSGVKTVRLRLNCWGHANAYDTLRGLIDPVAEKLDGWRGEANGFTIQRCWVVDEGDDLSEPEDATGVPLVGPYVDIEVTYAVAQQAAASGNAPSGAPAH